MFEIACCYMRMWKLRSNHFCSTKMNSHLLRISVPSISAVLLPRAYKAFQVGFQLGQFSLPNNKV